MITLGSLVAAAPHRSFYDLEARGNHIECVYKSVGDGHCDDQGCRDGGGWCDLNARGQCVMQNMRGKGAPFGCQHCGCQRA
jgi:hypothetical protein